MITLQAPARRGFCVPGRVVAPSGARQRKDSVVTPLNSICLWKTSLFSFGPLSGREQDASPGIPRPDFASKICPLQRAKNRVTCPDFLNALVGARNLPLRFDPNNLAGASGAIPPAVTGGGDGPLSCDLAGVNTFFPPLPSPLPLIPLLLLPLCFCVQCMRGGAAQRSPPKAERQDVTGSVTLRRRVTGSVTACRKMEIPIF